jgi:hypothetical protein
MGYFGGFSPLLDPVFDPKLFDRLGKGKTIMVLWLNAIL